MSSPSGPRPAPVSAVLLALSLLGFAAGAAAADTCLDPAGAPAEPRHDPAWLRQAQALSIRAREAAAEVLLIGDSITEWWPPTALRTLLGDRSYLNLGIAGDQTRHLLWRLRQGNIPERPPRAALLLIGTNDTTNRAAPAEVARAGSAPSWRRCASACRRPRSSSSGCCRAAAAATTPTVRPMRPPMR